MMNVPLAARNAQDRESGASNTRLATKENAAPTAAASPLEKAKVSASRTTNGGDAPVRAGMASAE